MRLDRVPGKQGPERRDLTRITDDARREVDRTARQLKRRAEVEVQQLRNRERDRNLARRGRRKAR